MQNTNPSLTKMLKSLAFSFIVLCSSQAFATDVTGSPTLVNYRDTSAQKYVGITISGTLYVAKWGGSSDPCFLHIPADSAKSMQNLASAALLSGKSVKISYNFCATDSYNYIYQVELIK